MFSVKGQMSISIWTIISVREMTMLTCLSVYQIPCGLGDLKECDGTHSERSARRVPTLRKQRKHRTKQRHLWDICGLSVAFSFPFLPFTFPFFGVLLYVIGVLNTQRCGVFFSQILKVLFPNSQSWHKTTTFCELCKFLGVIF